VSLRRLSAAPYRRCPAAAPRCRMALSSERLGVALGRTVTVTLKCGAFRGVLQRVNPDRSLLLRTGRRPPRGGEGSAPRRPSERRAPPHRVAGGEGGRAPPRRRHGRGGGGNTPLIAGDGCGAEGVALPWTPASVGFKSCRLKQPIC